MSKYAPTEAQRMAMEYRGNMIVSAAAGAGKTTVLTKRLAGIIREGTPVERLLVLTFTRAAAQEMRQRIEKELKEMVCEETDPDKQAFLLSEANAVSSAYISTIDSFCARVLRRYGHRIDVPASIRIGDAIELTLIAEQVKDELLHALGTEENADYRILLKAFRSEGAAWECVLKLNGFLDVRPDPEGWLKKLSERQARPDYAEEMVSLRMDGIRRMLRSALDDFESARDTIPGDWPRVLSVIDGDIMAVRGALIQEDPEAFRQSLMGIGFGRLVFPKNVPDKEKLPVKIPRDALKDAVKDVREKLTRSFEEEKDILELALPVERALIDVTARYRKDLLEAKKKAGVIDFSDAEHYALEILSDPEVAAEYREQFEYIAVDEYQDSNGLQEELLNRIKREDNLFLVGDVKQSIYRFRAAESRLFREKINDPADPKGLNGRRIDLTDNFRSHPNVLKAVNAVFEQVMTEEVGEIRYDAKVALNPGLTETDEGARAELHLIDKNFAVIDDTEKGDAETSAPVGEEKEDEAAELLADEADAAVEARLIAKRIKELMRTEPDPSSDKPFSPELYDDGKGERPYRYSDFAVLLRTGKNAQVIAETLALCGIPAFVQATGGIFDAIEVLTVLNLLRVIDNRRQDIPLVAVLRSPVFLFTDRELAEIRLLSPVGSFYESFLAAAEREDVPPEKTALIAKVKNAEAFFSRMHFESTLTGVAELVTRLIDETHYYEIIGAQPDGAQRRRNLDALVEQAQKFEDAGGSGIWRFLSAMDATKSGKSAAVGAAQESAGNVVRIMTVHKSKGLEFPVVFFADAARTFHGDKGPEQITVHEKLGIGIRFVEKGIRHDTVTGFAIAEKQALESKSEEMRILYVALTRAKRRLIIIGTVAKPDNYLLGHLRKCTPYAARTAGRPLDWIAFGWAASKKLLSDGTALKLMPEMIHAREELLTPEYAEEEMGPMVDTAPADISSLIARFSWRYPYQSATALPGKQSVSRAVYSAAPEKTSLPAFDEPVFMSGKTGEDTAALRGTVVHLILKTLPKDASDEQDIRAHVGQMLQTGVIEEEDTDDIRMEDLVWFVKTPLWARMNAAAVKHREWSFTRRLPAAECMFCPDGSPVVSDEPVLLQGVIDCCFIENGEWVLVDYKTDRFRPGVSPAEYAEKHRRQLTLYEDALAALTGKPVREKLLVLLGWHEIVSIENR